MKTAKVLPQVVVGWLELTKPTDIVLKIETAFPGVSRYVVRSSYSSEDLSTSSMAGKFRSEVNVESADLFKSIRRVFDSYGNGDQLGEVVLIQPYLAETKRSGVAFSCHQESGYRYLIDNYVIGSDTQAITSGLADGFRHVCLKYSPNVCVDKECLAIRDAIDECCSLLGIEALDVEYAFDKQGFLHVFQARPLVINTRVNHEIPAGIYDAYRFVQQKLKPTPFLAGKTTIFGVMPDWNPAEMIGRRPKMLAMSLYRELITDSIWAYQRDNYGYRTLRSFPLLVEIGNQPFIDTRVSFNSLLPKDIDDSLAEKLVNFYIQRLSENRHLHDKIEFEVVFSSWTFDLEEKMSSLPETFSISEQRSLANRLTSLTKNIILSDLIDGDINRVKRLSSRKNQILKGSLNRIDQLFWLLEDCKRWGTLPFAGLARSAFIATQILKSFEKLTGEKELFSSFVESIGTVTTQMTTDFQLLDRKDFVEKYGHLRPGTYDITSLTYGEAFDLYFGSNQGIAHKRYDERSHRNLEILLKESSLESELGIDAAMFLSFAKKSIFWREQAKFEFTKNLSESLSLICDIGIEFKISREDLAHINIKDLMDAYSESVDLKYAMQESILRGKDKYKNSTSIELPSVIVDARDVFSFTEQDSIPNFVTRSSVTGKLSSNLQDITGKVVLIRGADPGYDWIFEKKILALITAYGGANSHMAVRCSELNIPAAIGVGDRKFSELENSHHVYIDCEKRLMEYK